MAEFALGLTKTAVAGTVSRVKSAIEEEGKLRERVEEDLVFITGEFEMMQSFLGASNAGERASKNKVVRTWVRQLRNLAFDVEDCVEFVVHLDEPSPWDWVQRLTSSLRCLGRPPLPLDLAVAEIKRLKTRVEDVSQRNIRYNILAGSGDNDDESQHHPLLMRSAAGHTSAPGAECFRVLREVWKDMGKLPDTTGDLKRLIDCQGSELKVITLWGSHQADVAGELGWASIVKKAYVDQEICQQFKNRACVKLTSPFNPVDFLNNLLTHFISHHHERHTDVSKLMLQVSQYKYLIILEQELSCVADWEAIKMYLPDGNKGSRIIVSTKHLGIARVCTGEPFQAWELQHSSHDRHLCALFPEGCGHRIGMGEFVWQLRQQGGVISLYWQDRGEIAQLMNKLYDGGNASRGFDGVKFEQQCHLYPCRGGTFDLAHLALNILAHPIPESEQDGVELFEAISEALGDQDLLECCRQFLTEHDYLIYIEDLRSPADWDLIKKHLLCDSTRGCIVVITGEQSVAKHCVGHQQHLVLNVEDIIKGSNQQGQSGLASSGGSINEERKFGERDCLIGLPYDYEYFFVPYETVLSVWGIAGVGKSAIVREMCYKYKQETRPGADYKMYGWVDVPDPFSLTDLCQRLLLDLYSDDVDAKETAAIGMMEGHDPIQGCRKILSENKCLLVIDGLGSTHDWDMIKSTVLSQANSGGTTIVITREESIARYCTNKDRYILNVKGLDADMANYLFKKITCGGKELAEFPPEAETISKLIMHKCGGIPEVIVGIGNVAYLSTHWFVNEDIKDNLCRVLPALESINSDFMRILVDSSSSSSSLRRLLCWMQSYFDACSDELKPCIFYLSIFPANGTIRRRRLVRRWIAEGYSSGGGGTLEEKGEKLYSDLLKLSILYPEKQFDCVPTEINCKVPTTRSCKVNGFFLEYIKSRPMEDNLVFALEGSCNPDLRLTGQHLTISSTWDRDEIVFKSMDFSRLRSLTVFGEWKSFIICEKMKMLRVLDLEGTRSTLDGTASAVKDDDLEMIVKQFPRLKFLSLRGCVHITRLPDLLGAMRQLETLDVRHTSIVELPSAIITKLHKLQYIRAGSTRKGRWMAAAGTPPPPSTTQDIHSCMSPLVGATTTALCVVQRASTRITGAWKGRAHALVESSSSSWWESKKRRMHRDAANGSGVVVVGAAVESIGKLMELHTLGVLNIAVGKDGLVFLKEIKKLTQLRKVGLSGINRKNWKHFCLAVSGLPHLESLSPRLLLLEGAANYDFACFDDISELPKTLKSLKVTYSTITESRFTALRAGGPWIKPGWIKKLPNLEKFQHVLTVSSQEDIDSMLKVGSPFGPADRIRIKTIAQQHLSFNKPSRQIVMRGLIIICSSFSTTVTFGELSNCAVGSLTIYCCSSCAGSVCLRIEGLQNIHDLNAVTVMGPCSNDFKEDLRKQLDEHENKSDISLSCRPDE